MPKHDRIDKTDRLGHYSYFARSGASQEGIMNVSTSEEEYYAPNKEEKIARTEKE